MPRDKKKPIPEVKTTGHEWDGIIEYDNPDPFILRLTFYAALFFALLYWILYPSWPTPHSDGIVGWTSLKQLKEQQAEIEKVRAEYQADFEKATFAEIMKDPALMKYALAGGQSAFQNNCAVCHGFGGGGNPGYPNLTAGAWLWGGSIDDIYQTIKYGIRSGHEDARDSNMAAFGRDEIITKEQINILTDYVMHLRSGIDKGSPGYKLFQDNCASCHGADGGGGRDFGAPALNDAVWLYGSDRNTIFDVIYNGRAGVMPYWVGKLDDTTIRQLAIYVHQLGGGE